MTGLDPTYDVNRRAFLRAELTTAAAGVLGAPNATAREVKSGAPGARLTREATAAVRRLWASQQ